MSFSLVGKGALFPYQRIDGKLNRLIGGRFGVDKVLRRTFWTVARLSIP